MPKQLAIRVDDALLTRIEEHARQNERTIAQTVRYLLQRGFDMEGFVGAWQKASSAFTVTDEGPHGYVLPAGYFHCADDRDADR